MEVLTTPTTSAQKIPYGESVRENGLDRERQLSYKTTYNLIQLDQITLDNVLECLVERFRSREYHTFAGSVLISLNPCLKSSRSSFDERQIRVKYEDINDLVRSSPHVYSVGQHSLKNIAVVGNHQTIVVSGDSGAGKTTATQQLIKYFIERNTRLVEKRTPNNLDKKIYYSTLILESLGNASTVANHNSSRFGRLVQLTLDTGTSSIIGGKIRTCLLEKHRVSKCSPNERNFHIFYYLLCAIKNDSVCLQDFSEKIESNVEYLIPDYFNNGLKPTDGEEFRTLHQSLSGLSLSAELNNIFRVVFGIMVLLNVRFEENTTCDDIKEFTASEPGLVEILGDIFGIDGEQLVAALVARKITAGGMGTRRKSIFVRRCDTMQECHDRLSAMASTLYDALFNHVLCRLNKMLNCKQTSMSYQNDNDSYAPASDASKHLSLLDLYGFENFQNNQLEQLCINYANERLQQLHVSKMKGVYGEMIELEKYCGESIELFKVEKENSERIDELETTVMSIFNEECLLNRGSKTKMIFERLSLATKASKYIQASKFETETCPFVVKHYASDVKYNLEGMIAKNTDYIPPEFYEVFGCSKNFFIKSLISSSNATSDENANRSVKANNAKNKSKKGKTVLQRFKIAVDDLINELITEENHDIHFIRCIRPNSELAEGKIQHDVVKRQLYSSGIVDIIRVAGNGYPVRVLKTKFTQQFSATLRRHCNNAFNENLIRQLVPFDESELRFGVTKVFMSETCWNFMKGIEKCITNGNVTIIQRAWRNCLKKRELKNIMHAQSVAEKKPDINIMSSPGPWGDSFVVVEKLNTKISIQNDIKSKIKLISFHQRKTFETVKWNLQSLMNEIIFIGDRIVSRGQIYQPPIRFNTKRSSLLNSHVVPIRLKPKGVIDALGEKRNLTSNITAPAT